MTPKVRQLKGHNKVDTTVREGNMSVTSGFFGREARVVLEGPWPCKALFLWRAIVCFLFEGILRKLPFDLRSAQALRRANRPSAANMFAFSCDGASSNTMVLEWMWELLADQQQMDNTLPVKHFCNMPGVAIAKAKVAGPRNLANTLLNFGKRMRMGENIEARVPSLHHVVAPCFRVVR